MKTSHSSLPTDPDFEAWLIMEFGFNTNAMAAGLYMISLCEPGGIIAQWLDWAGDGDVTPQTFQKISKGIVTRWASEAYPQCGVV